MVITGRWSNWKPAERQMLLLKLADLVEQHIEELAALDTFDMGTPISRTRNNRRRAVGMLRYYAGMATALHGETIDNSLPGEIFSFTLKEPIGVVGAIIPWNGPLTATIWKIGPALATGCTVVLKPAEEAPLTSLRLGELCLETGVPPGVEGAKRLSGGEQLTEGEYGTGYFVPPTVFADVRDDRRIAWRRSSGR
jgi:aldehyde dehydrogenase (NAD+)